MPIPEKAIAYESIQCLLIEKARIDDGSHEIYRIDFNDGGEIKKGFFKKIDDKYPEFLAKIAVAASCLQRNVLGSRASEERLVMRDQEIVGTLSVEMDGFEPLKYRGKDEKSQVIPTTLQLLQENVIELLFAAKMFANDDLHPHNLSMKGLIDMDMCYRFLVLPLKPRIIPELIFKTLPQISLPELFTPESWSNFPCESGANTPWHWPTFLHPGEGSLSKTPVPTQILSLLPKGYADPLQFIQLAAEPLAHRQKLIVALKFILSYQPSVIRRRLKKYLANLPLDYEKLEEAIVLEYQVKFPELFSEETNKKPFLEFMMKLYEHQYLNLYQTLIFDRGGCNIKGYSLEPINRILRCATYYQEVLDWMHAENSTNYKDAPSLQFNIDEAKESYSLFWQRTFILSIQNIQEFLHEKVISEIYKAFADKDLGFFQVVEKERFLEVPDYRITEREKARLGLTHYGVTVGPEIINFATDFKKILDLYFRDSPPEREQMSNKKFLESLSQLSTRGRRILKKIPTDKPSFKNFKEVLSQLQTLQEKINFAQHLLSTPSPIELKTEEFDILLDELQEPAKEVDLFFAQINQVETKIFDETLVRIVYEKYRVVFGAYNPSLLNPSPPEPDINALLEKNEGVKNHHKLALILKMEDFFTEMNRLVVEQLLKMYFPKLSHSVALNSLLIEATVNFVRSKEYDVYNQQDEEDALMKEDWEVLSLS